MIFLWLLFLLGTCYIIWGSVRRLLDEWDQRRKDRS